jgi:hypothetical protein
MVHHNVDPNAPRIVPATMRQEDDRDLERCCDESVADARDPDTDIRGFYCEATHHVVVFGFETEEGYDIRNFWERAA